MDPEQTATGAARRMFRRDSLYTVGFVLQLGIGSIVTPILTRVLGSSGYGRIAACMAVMQVLVTLEGLGLNAGILRIAAMEGLRAGRAVLGFLLATTLAFNGVLLATYPLWARSLGFASSREALVLTIVWSALAACTLVTLALLRSADRLAVVIAVDAVQLAGGQAVGLLLAEFSRDGVTAYLSGIVAMQALALAIGLWHSPPSVRLRRHRGALRRALAFSLPMLPQFLSTFALSTSDRLILGRDLGPIPVGRYQVAYGLACIAILMIGVLSTQWLPSLLAITGSHERRQAIALSRDRLLTMTVPVVLGLCAGIPELLRYWVSAQYAPAGLTTVVVLVVASTIPVALYTGHLLVLFVEGRTRACAVVNILAAALNIGLNLILVPRLGINGAAASTLIAYVALWLMTARVARRSPLRLSVSPRATSAAALAAALAAASAFVGVDGTDAAIVRWACTAGAVVILGLIFRDAGPPGVAAGADQPAGA